MINGRRKSSKKYVRTCVLVKNLFTPLSAACTSARCHVWLGTIENRVLCSVLLWKYSGFSLYCNNTIVTCELAQLTMWSNGLACGLVLTLCTHTMVIFFPLFFFHFFFFFFFFFFTTENLKKKWKKLFGGKKKEKKLGDMWFCQLYPKVQ